MSLATRVVTTIKGWLVPKKVSRTQASLTSEALSWQQESLFSSHPGFAIIEFKNEGKLCAINKPISNWTTEADLDNIQVERKLAQLEVIDDPIPSNIPHFNGWVWLDDYPIGRFFSDIYMNWLKSNKNDVDEKFINPYRLKLDSLSEFGLICDRDTSDSHHYWFLKLPLKSNSTDNLRNPIRGLAIPIVVDRSLNSIRFLIHPDLRLSRDGMYLVLPLTGPYEGIIIAIDRNGKLYTVEKIIRETDRTVPLFNVA